MSAPSAPPPPPPPSSPPPNENPAAQPVLSTPEDEAVAVAFGAGGVLPAQFADDAIVRLHRSAGDTLPNGRHVRVSNPTIDVTRLDNSHTWNPFQVHEMNFHRFVRDAGDARRPDMQRWLALYEQRGHNATIALWGDFVRRRMFFLIPATITTTTRTFARDPLEALYVDRMARAIESPTPLRDVRDLPLYQLRDSLLGRWWNAFNVRNHFLIEADVRANDGLMVPYDSLEVP